MKLTLSLESEAQNRFIATVAHFSMGLRASHDHTLPLWMRKCTHIFNTDSKARCLDSCVIGYMNVVTDSVLLR